MSFVLQAWNIQNSLELSLSGPVGLVYALAVGNDMLLAGTQVNCFLFSYVDYVVCFIENCALFLV